MKRYKVKEAAEIAGMTPQTLRRYDKLQILQPVRDEGNRYRFYEWTDMVQLLRIKYLRQMGLDLSGVCAVYERDLTEAEAAFGTEEAAMEAQLRALERQIRWMHAHRERLNLWQQAREQGVLLRRREACLVFPFRTQDGIAQEEETRTALRAMLEEMPPLRSGTLMPAEDAAHVRYQGVLFAFESEVEQPNRLLEKGCVRLPACDCLVAASSDIGTMRYRSDRTPRQPEGERLLALARAHGYRVTGSILGEVLHMRCLPADANLPRMQNFRHYSLNWIPVEREDKEA